MLLAAATTLAILPAAVSAAGTLSNFKPVNSYRNGLFRDVASRAWYAEKVRSAYELGLMKGSGNNTFNPEGSVTLAETVTMAARLHSIYYDNAESFQPIAPAWYSAYVDYAKKNGILKQDYANYNAAATRAQFASIFANALPSAALAEINDVPDGSIPDVSASHRNAREIYLLYRAGILTGSDEDLTFRPTGPIQRSEAATIVTNMALQDKRVKMDSKPVWNGDPSQDFTVQLTNDTSFTLSEQAGKVVLLNFWATWCGPCVREMPDLDRLYEKYSDNDSVVILAVNVGESSSTVQRFITQQGFGFPVACDSDTSISSAYNITAIPRTIIFNKDGTVSEDLTGSRNYETFQSAVENALGG